MGKTGYRQLEDLEYEIIKEKFNGLFPHKCKVYSEVCVIDHKNKNPLQRAIVTRCFPHYIKDSAVSYEVELISTKEKRNVTENDLIIPTDFKDEIAASVQNEIAKTIKDKECSTIETNIEEPIKITAVSGEKNINDILINTDVEKVQVIEDKLEDLNKNLDKKLEKVSKLTKLLFISHFI